VLVCQLSVLLDVTGAIVTRRQLDRESMPEHWLTVVAQDGGGLQCRSVVHVTLTDVNDNAPQFVPRSHYIGSVAEDAAVGTPVLRLAVVDPDVGVNRRIRYSMEPSRAASVFVVDAVSGVITLLQSLDREQQDSYNLTVSASDQVSLLNQIHNNNNNNNTQDDIYSVIIYDVPYARVHCGSLK